MYDFLYSAQRWADVCTQIHPYTQMALGILTSAAQVCLLVANGTHLTPFSLGDHYASEPRPIDLRLASTSTNRLRVPS